MPARMTRFALGALVSTLLPGVAAAAEPKLTAPPSTAPSPAPPVTPAPATITGPVTLTPGAGPLDLEGAVHLALTRNERAKISDLNVVVAEAAVEKARAGFLPLLTAGGQDTQHAYAVEPEQRRHRERHGRTSRFSTRPLFPLYAQAKELANAQHAQNVDDKRLLAFSAATAFFTVLNAQDVVTAAQRAARQLEGEPGRHPGPRRGSAHQHQRRHAGAGRPDRARSARSRRTRGSLDNAYVQLAFTINAPVPSRVVPPAATLAAALQPAGGPDDPRALRDRPPARRAGVAVPGRWPRTTSPTSRCCASSPRWGCRGRCSTGNALPADAAGPTRRSRRRSPGRSSTRACATRTSTRATRRPTSRSSNLQLLDRNVDAQVRERRRRCSRRRRPRSEPPGTRRSSRARTSTRRRSSTGRGWRRRIELVDANDSRFTAEVNFATAEFTMAQAYLALRQALGLEPLGTELK